MVEECEREQDPRHGQNEREYAAEYGRVAWTDPGTKRTMRMRDA